MKKGGDEVPSSLSGYHNFAVILGSYDLKLFITHEKEGKKDAIMGLCFPG